MAPQKPPAFQFYPKDFNSGTATFSLQEVGAYIRLLNHQWDHGSIPFDPKERARICVCSKAQEREIWKTVGRKFIAQDGALINVRLEEERVKQAEYRKLQADKGKAGAAARWQQDNGTGYSNGHDAAIDLPLPNASPKHGSSSSSSSSKKNVPVPNAFFDRWWSAYPKKVGKGSALKAWNGLDVSEELLAQMLRALQWQRTQPQWTKDGGAYIPNPATYLNQARWEDEPFFTETAPALESPPDHPHLKKLREMGIAV